MQRNHKKAFSLVEISVVILIIGVLIAGIAKGSRVIKHFKEASRENSTQGIAAYMQSLDGLRLWMDASAPNSFGQEAAPSDGAEITAWNDIISNHNPGYSPYVFTKFGNPTYVKNAINGQPAVDFDGSGDYFSFNGGVLDAGDNSYTVAVVWNTDSANTQVVWEQNAATSSAGRRAAIIVWSVSGGYEFNDETNNFGNSLYSGGNTNVGLDTTNSRNIVTIAVHDGNEIILYDNGKKYSGTLSGVPDIGSEYTAIGRKVNNSEYLDGRVAELIIFDKALTHDQSQVIQDYLMKKYSIEKSN